MRPENVWFVAQGRGFNSRHLHPCDLRRRWSVGTKVVIRSFGWLPSCRHHQPRGVPARDSEVEPRSGRRCVATREATRVVLVMRTLARTTHVRTRVVLVLKLVSTLRASPTRVFAMKSPASSFITRTTSVPVLIQRATQRDGSGELAGLVDIEEGGHPFADGHPLHLLAGIVTPWRAPEAALRSPRTAARPAAPGPGRPRLGQGQREPGSRSGELRSRWRPGR